jgi:RNA polymerase sigma-54 factor
MRDLIAQAPGPLTDGEIARRLGMAGITLARRTVAKYREQLGIPARHARRTVA